MDTTKLQHQPHNVVTNLTQTLGNVGWDHILTDAILNANQHSLGKAVFRLEQELRGFGRRHFQYRNLEPRSLIRMLSFALPQTTVMDWLIRDAVAAEVPTKRFEESPSFALVLVPYGKDYAETLDLLLGLGVKDQAHERYAASLNQTLRNNFEPCSDDPRSCLRWELIDLGPNWPECKEVDFIDLTRCQRMSRPEGLPWAGIIAAAAEYPQWMATMDGQIIPNILIPGLKGVKGLRGQFAAMYHSRGEKWWQYDVWGSHDFSGTYQSQFLGKDEGLRGFVVPKLIWAGEPMEFPE